MEKEIIKECIELLSTKFYKNKRLIEIMITDTLQCGYNINETVNIIENFYRLKGMQ